jgi:hypothetical protein
MWLVQPTFDDTGILRRPRVLRGLQILPGLQGLRRLQILRSPQPLRSLEALRWLQALRSLIFGRRDLRSACRLDGRLRRRGGGLLEDRARTSRGRRRCVLAGLPVGNEFVVARSARPRRNVIRHAAGPMRPMVGNIAGKLSAAAARPETRAETEHDRRRDASLDDHSCRRAVEPARKLPRAALIIRFDRVAV